MSSGSSRPIVWGGRRATREIIESGRYPFERMHTASFPLERAEDAIRALAGAVPGLNPIHLTIVPGARP